MHCRAAQSLISAARDGALPPAQEAALGGHLRECADCRTYADELQAAALTWQTKAQAVTLPNPAAEWQQVRTRLHQADASAHNAPVRRWQPWAALGLPTAIAAALALFFVFGNDPAEGDGAWSAPGARVAAAEFLQTDEAAASTLIFVDEQSGWLIVWAEPA